MTIPVPRPAPVSTEDSLPESASVFLDLVRFSAALLVVVAHLTHPEFHTGAANMQILGDIAVPVFFVLSGFVIRFVTLSRETTLREYAIDRASRIYSVVLPAMIFTLLAGAACYGLDSGRFVHEGWIQSFQHPFLRLALNLSFLSQAWGYSTIPFINSPFWSLGYECFYYAFYGVVFFLRGWRRVCGITLLALIIGPQVLFLLPVWWLGCWLYDAYRVIRRTSLRPCILGIGSGCLALALLLAAFGQPALLQLPVRIFHGVAGLPNPIGTMLHMQPRRATMLAVAVGLYAAVALFFLLLAIDGVEISRSSRWVRSLRRAAEGTFAIYLFHYPALVLAGFLGLLRYRQVETNSVVAALICFLLILTSGPIDGLKRLMRRWLRAAWPQ